MSDVLENKYLPTSFHNYLGDNRVHIVYSDEEYSALYDGVDNASVLNNLHASRWYTGQVPNVHFDFLSFGAGKRVIDSIANKACSFMLDGNTETISTFKKYIDEDTLESVITEMFTFQQTRGSVLLKLDSEDGYPIINVVRLGRFRINKRRGPDIIDVEIFIDNFKVDLKQYSYVIYEHRYYKTVKEGLIDVTKAMSKLQVRKIDRSMQGKVTKVEYDIKNDKELLKTFTELGYSFTERELPISTLGVALVNNSKVNSTHPRCMYGDSSFLGNEDVLWSLDHAFTCKENDKYLGRGRALVPKPMQASVGNIASMNSMINGIGSSIGIVNPINHRGVLDTTFFNEVPSGFNPNELMKPTPIQFDLRIAEWRQEIIECIGDIAFKFGITANMIDSRLVGSGQKTATQIMSEEDMTRETIEAKRKLATAPLNAILKCACELIGLSPIKISWSKAGVSNYNVLSQTTIAEYNNGLCSLQEALERLHPNWTSEQIENEINRINNEQELNAENEFNNE